MKEKSDYESLRQYIEAQADEEGIELDGMSAEEARSWIEKLLNREIYSNWKTEAPEAKARLQRGTVTPIIREIEVTQAELPAYSVGKEYTYARGRERFTARRWTGSEEKALRKLVKSGVKWKAVAARLHRSEGSVKRKHGRVIRRKTAT